MPEGTPSAAVVEGILAHLKKKRHNNKVLQEIIHACLRLAREQDASLSNQPTLKDVRKAAEAAHRAVVDLIQEIAALGLGPLAGSSLQREALPAIDLWRGTTYVHPRADTRDYLAARHAKDLIETCTLDEPIASSNVLAIARLIYEGAYGLPANPPDYWLLKSCQNVMRPVSPENPLDKRRTPPGIRFDTVMPDTDPPVLKPRKP
jgi:hypothetical protein